MGIELSSIVTGSQVDLDLVDETSDLDIVGCSDELNALECTIGNEAGTVAMLCAPGDLLTFGIADG